MQRTGPASSDIHVSRWRRCHRVLDRVCRAVQPVLLSNAVVPQSGQDVRYLQGVDSPPAGFTPFETGQARQTGRPSPLLQESSAPGKASILRDRSEWLCALSGCYGRTSYALEAAASAPGSSCRYQSFANDGNKATTWFSTWRHPEGTVIFAASVASQWLCDRTRHIGSCPSASTRSRRWMTTRTMADYSTKRRT